MAEFIKQFGIDWRLLVSQAVNFLLVLIILRMFVYKPVVVILRDRRRRVEEGIAKAKEADARLADARETVRERMYQAETEAMALLRQVEEQAKSRKQTLLESSRRKGEVMLLEARKTIDAEQEKVRAELDQEARGLLRAALVNVVEMDPEQIDESLIEKALAGAARRV